MGDSSNTRASLLARARDLEELIVGLLIDFGAYLHGPDPERLQDELRRLRVELRHVTPSLLLLALRRLAAAGRVPTVEAVATESGIAPAHVKRLVDEVADIVDLRALEDELLDVRRRVELDSLASVLQAVAFGAGRRDVERIFAAAAAVVDAVRFVEVPRAAPSKYAPARLAAIPRNSNAQQA